MVTPPVYVHDKTAKTRALAKITLEGGTFLLGYEYDYDALDNRSHLWEIDENNTRTATGKLRRLKPHQQRPETCLRRLGKESYVYDELSRLTSVTYKDNVTEIAAVETTPTKTRNLPAQVRQGIKVQSAQADFGACLRSRN